MNNNVAPFNHTPLLPHDVWPRATKTAVLTLVRITEGAGPLCNKKGSWNTPVHMRIVDHTATRNSKTLTAQFLCAT